MLVAMGEIGVMFPGNRGVVTELVTYGASPCVILGVQKGDIMLLAHIHRGNKVRSVLAQIRQILADANPPGSAAKAFITTEKYIKNREEADHQERIVEELKLGLSNQGVTLCRECWDKSSARITADGFQLLDDSDVISSLNTAESIDSIYWSDAYDRILKLSTNSFKMVIRVGNLPYGVNHFQEVWGIMSKGHGFNPFG
ncbi:hypothetical protein [Chromobacterium haemolyticum]|uniref:hypothetical protein n=1 Tax=Chromobacterium haemolyticum TaxID=394935 RepID=UPI0011B1D7F0|nr:hypothetical protein [Chromobacterium haemolyticum]